MNASVTLWEATAPVKLPIKHCPHTGLRHGLESSKSEGGISTVTPPRLASRLLRLPPILHTQTLNSISDCSKAPRGLFVLLLISGIFTGNVVSPSPSLRQSSDRSAIRAGRNLPDKEFRYLRTVIVTAAIHQGLIFQLCSEELTSPRDLLALGKRQSLYILFQIGRASCRERV